MKKFATYITLPFLVVFLIIVICVLEIFHLVDRHFSKILGQPLKNWEDYYDL